MNRSSIFKLKIDFIKSHGAYLFDKNSNHEFLDFMSMYATLPLGYNHPIFSNVTFKSEIERVSSVKITNCEMLSDEAIEFNEKFITFAGKGLYSHAHYCCTGALAIESAIKTAIDYKKSKTPNILSFKGSFHGINGYGGFITDRFDPVSKRLDGFPGNFWTKLNNPFIKYQNNLPVDNKSEVNAVLAQAEQEIQNDPNISCILIEPIQCTFGDMYFPKEFFIGLRKLCDKYDIPLIFDEIQIGFGTTGKLWYFEYLGIEPDIIVFGKKTQLSGILVKSKYSTIFNSPGRLEVTWDADLIDMIRCKYVMEAYEKYGILHNVNNMSNLLFEGLKNSKNIQNIRRCGLIVAFDLSSKERRDKFMNFLISKNFICNPTRDITIRLRPNLYVKEEEISQALNILCAADKNI